MHTEIDPAYAECIHLPIQLAEQLARFCFITIRADTFDAHRFAKQDNFDGFVAACGTEADADGSFHVMILLC
jgi:hypothetical protein